MTKKEIVDIIRVEFHGNGNYVEAFKKAAEKILAEEAKGKPTEPLALEELARRKGCELLQFGRMTENLYMQSIRRPDGNDFVVEGCSPLCTKAKTRAYLMALEDKEGV